MIRDMRHDDIPRIVQIGRGFFKEAGFADHMRYSERDTAQSLAGFIDSNLFGSFVSEHEGRVHGMAVGVVMAPFYNESHPVLMELAWWVDPENPAVGDGVRLLHALEGWGLSNGAKSSVISSFPGYDGGSLLERLGYSVIETKHAKELTDGD